MARVITLALVRHAPTDWNLEKRLQGRKDLPVSAAGMIALRERVLPEMIREWPVFCSPLLRARQTADYLAPQGYCVRDCLVEMNWGAWEGQRLVDLRSADPQGMAAQEARGLDFQPPGGESPRQVQGRLLPFCLELASAEKSSVLVTHKGVIRALIALTNGWDMCGDHVPKIRYNAIHLVDMDVGGRFMGVRLNQLW